MNKLQSQTWEQCATHVDPQVTTSLPLYVLPISLVVALQNIIVSPYFPKNSTPLLVLGVNLLYYYGFSLFIICMRISLHNVTIRRYHIAGNIGGN